MNVLINNFFKIFIVFRCHRSKDIIKKLEKYGICGKKMLWFKSILNIKMVNGRFTANKM